MIKRFIPNLITLGNLFCGLLAIKTALEPEGNLTLASWFIVAGMGFDFMDGFVARLLGVSSPLGKQLDSLADVITFGAAPAFVLFHYTSLAGGGDGPYYLVYLPFLIALFSALRLAKFNIDENQTTYFIGMPTPANALAIISIPLMIADGIPGWAESWLTNPYFLGAFSILCSVWLVAPVALFSLKIKAGGLKKNLLPLVFVITSGLLISLLRFTAVPIVILLYLLLSWIFFDPKKHEIQS